MSLKRSKFVTIFCASPDAPICNAAFYSVTRSHTSDIRFYESDLAFFRSPLTFNHRDCKGVGVGAHIKLFAPLKLLTFAGCFALFVRRLISDRCLCFGFVLCSDYILPHINACVNRQNNQILTHVYQKVHFVPIYRLKKIFKKLQKILLFIEKYDYSVFCEYYHSISCAYCTRKEGSCYA